MGKQVKNLGAIQRRMQKNSSKKGCICRGKGCKNCQAPGNGGGQPNASQQGNPAGPAKKGNQPPWLKK